MIKKGIKVKILTGKDKNKDGEVIEIDRPNNRAKVKGINLVKKHVKTTKEKKVEYLVKKIFYIFQILKLFKTPKKTKKLKLKNDTKIERNIF